jgi:hypothetical protein
VAWIAGGTVDGVRVREIVVSRSVSECSSRVAAIYYYYCYYNLNRFIPGEKILMLYFLLAFSRTELNLVLLWILLVSVYPLNKSETFQLLKSVMF